METIISQRGKRLILYGGYKFRKIRKTLDGWLWRCTKKTCNSTLRLDDNEAVILREDIHHNHEPARNAYVSYSHYSQARGSKFPAFDDDYFLQWLTFLNPYYTDRCCHYRSHDAPFLSNFNDMIRFLFLDKNLGKHFLLSDEESLNFGIDLSLSNSKFGWFSYCIDLYYRKLLIS